MGRPTKVICEITAEGYSVTVLNAAGEQVFRTEHKMESGGQASGDGNNIFDCAALGDYEQLTSEVDDITMGLFDVACELYTIEEIESA